VKIYQSRCGIYLALIHIEGTCRPPQFSSNWPENGPVETE
jgi:hypothetical protein